MSGELFGDGMKLDYNKIRRKGLAIYIPPELSAPVPELDAMRFLQEAEKQLLNDALVEKRKNFFNNYSAMYANVPLPLTMRLVYDDFASWDFQSSGARHFVFDAMACSKRILEVFGITEKPDMIELHVWRPPFRHPRDESRIHPPERDPRNGSWITVMSLNVQEETPFFSFDELDLAHMELWEWMRDYARRSMNPCGELPLGETKIGRYLPKQ